MERDDYVRCCRAMEEGEEVLLENVEEGSAGRLLFCSPDGFEVVVDGHREHWPSERCEEIGATSESPHENL